MINLFADILRDGFEWHSYCDPGGSLFEVRMVKAVEQGEWLPLYTRLTESISREIYGDMEIEALLGRAAGRGYRRFSRRRYEAEEEDVPELTLEDALQRLGMMVGLQELKEEVQKAVSFVKWLKNNQPDIAARKAYPFHYICTTEGEGVGLSTALQVLALIFYHLGLCDHHGITEERVYSGYLDFHQFGESGIYAVLDADLLKERELAELMDRMRGDYSEKMVVLVMDAEKKDDLKQLQRNLEAHGVLYRDLHLPAYTEGQLRDIFNQIMATYGRTLDPESEEVLEDFLAQAREEGTLRGVRTVKKIACRLAAEINSAPLAEQTGPDVASGNKLMHQFLHGLLKQNDQGSNITPVKDPLKELDELIGLSAVKARVNEILGHIIAEKQKAQLGIKDSGLCMHMLFTGNPGTGKTTVARIVGQLLKKEGLLKKGDLIEVCREDLVALYVGHTAPKTAAVVKRSLGSVLFIDEAYSLNGGYEKDFGREALATLVKKMEEHKDELVVILAGYTDEMEQLLCLNPGLSSRVPHQIEFPDYSGEELYRIFKRHLGREYHISTGAAAKLKDLFAKVSTASSPNFGNGRFVRNVIERLKMKQGQRLLAEGFSSREAMLQITDEDVRKLLQDSDISRQLVTARKVIGFA